MLSWNVFDGLILAVLAVCIFVWPTQLISDRANRWARITAVSLIALQLLVDGPRPQLLPVYLIAVLFLLLLIVDRSSRKEPSLDREREREEGLSKKFARWTLVLGTSGLLLISTVFCLLFPRFQYPAPTGNYSIGTKEIRLIDESRPELYTERLDDHREISARITYPAEIAEHVRPDVAHSDAAGILALLLQSSKTLLWGAITTHAKVGAPVSTAQAKYPVLIFSHGYPTGFPEQNTVLVEHLASHGFIVMAINHAWQSLYYEFANGTVANLSVLTKLENSLGPPPTEAQQKEEAALWRQATDPKNTSIKATSGLFRKAARINPRAQQFNSITHKLVSDDQRFLMSRLVDLQNNDPLFASHLDLDRIGIFGHSTGGTASQITCTVDDRCRAGINLDGFQPLLLELPPLERPFMHFSSRDALYVKISHLQSKAPNYFAYINGAGHFDFTDAMLSMSLLKRLDLLGKIDTQRMYEITNNYVLAFFDKHLRGRSEPLLDRTNSSYAEVTFLSK